MNARHFSRLALATLTALWIAAPTQGAPSYEHGAVATVHPLATQAGVDALKAGGNAVDAAVATALMLGVVDGQNSGIGGGCFITLRLADGRFLAIDGRETAPAAATRDMYLRDGHAVPALSQHGALSVGVPGQLAALAYISTNFGRLPISRHLSEAARVAEGGFEVSRSYEGRLSSALKEIAPLPPTPFAEFRRIFTREPGSGIREAWHLGERLAQPDLARTYRTLAAEGVGSFYRGSFASATAQWMRDNGGLLTTANFASYQPKLRQPIRTRYRGHDIVGFPPPSSGGVHVGQILNILEHYDLRKLGNGSADFVHVIAEAMKLAFADRAHWLGDPDFTRVPKGLASTEYAQDLAARIQMDKVTPITQHGIPPRANEDVFPRVEPIPTGPPDGKHTTHFSTADSKGNWVACTATINTTFGSKVVIPGTGVVLNNEMDDFSAEPGAPNAFGLVGAEANAVAPGKRPLSSMSPTLVLKDGQPILSVGAAGGPTIISQTLLAIIQIVDFGSDPATALGQPRFHQQWRPDELVVEKSMPESVRTELTRRGHKLKLVNQLGACQAVGLRRVNGTPRFEGAHDPRVEGSSDGY